MHQILRQVVAVDVNGGEDVGREVQRRVSELCRHAVSAYLEVAFAPFDAVETYVVIDRLDVDLGDVRLERLESALTTSLSTAVATTLRERGLTPHSPASGVSLQHGGLSPVEALITGVLHFLRHGRLPWWYVRADSRTLEERLLGVLASDVGEMRPRVGDSSDPRSSHVAFLEDLVRLLRSNGTARQRLLHQFSMPCLLTLLEKINAELHRDALRALKVVHGSSLSGSLRDRLENGVLEAAIEWVASDTGRSVLSPMGQLLQMSADRLAPSLPRIERDRVATALGVDTKAEFDRRAAPDPAPAGDEIAVCDGLLVDNAGVVLLHAFLPQFFAALGLVEDEALVRPSRAALLLHHLATGAPTAEEHELVFAKVLCGLPIESALPSETPVTAKEQAEATALLDSVVRHWEALRNTSADGLRGNFLTRPGRIELRDDDWVLRIETRSYDVLLESLPWGIAHLKLPWMSRLMNVEWTA